MKYQECINCFVLYVLKIQDFYVDIFSQLFYWFFGICKEFCFFDFVCEGYF